MAVDLDQNRSGVATDEDGGRSAIDPCMTSSTLPAPPPPSPDRLFQQRHAPDAMTAAEIVRRRWWLHFNARTRPSTTTAIRCCRKIIALVDEVDGVRVIARRGEGSYNTFDLFASSPCETALIAADGVQVLTCRTCEVHHLVASLRRDRHLARRRNVNL